MKVNIMLCLGEYSLMVYRALLAEEKQPAPEKGRVKLSLSGGCLGILVESDSLSGLRALTNSFLLLAHAAYSVLREAESVQNK